MEGISDGVPLTILEGEHREGAAGAIGENVAVGCHNPDFIMVNIEDKNKSHCGVMVRYCKSYKHSESNENKKKLD